MTLDCPTDRLTFRRVPHRRAAPSMPARLCSWPCSSPFACLRMPVALAAVAMGILPGAASAGEFSVGLGAGADRGKVDCVASAPCDHRSTHWQLFADYALNDAVVLRAVGFDAGRFDGGDTTPQGLEFGGRFKASGVGLTAGYRWALAPQWSLTGRAGLAAVRTRFDYANPVWGSASKTTAQPLVGGGLSYAVTPALRLGVDWDLTRFKVHTTQGPLQMLGVSAQLSF